MRFSHFAEFLEKLENTASRNEITEIIAVFLHDSEPHEAKLCFYLLTGRLLPKFEPLEFNFSRKLMFKSLESVGVEKKAINAIFKQYGDAGLVAKEVLALAKESGQTSLLVSTGVFKVDTVADVYEVLTHIAKAEGKGSQEVKQSTYMQLIQSVEDPRSVIYISRIIVGDLRLGVSDKTLLDSLSWFAVGDKSLRKELDKAYGAKADIGKLAETVVQTVQKNAADPLEKLTATLARLTIEVGTPVASKLVEREKDAAKVWERMPECWVQPKLDGLRGQIHMVKNKDEVNVRIFSRNMEDMTDQFPELVESVSALPYSSVILDSEIIGFNTETNEYLSYQETMRRKRKYDVADFAEKIPVKAMCFDVLYFEGNDISHEPIEKRIQILAQVTQSADIHLDMLETIQMKSEDDLSDYFFEQVHAGLEGIITKEKESVYEPGTRNYTWIKLKANTQSSLVDTLDVIVMGYYIGRGQRSKNGIGALLTGVYDPETEQFLSVGKVGSGITDEQFPIIRKDLDALEVQDKPESYVVEKQLEPDVWISPKIIAEIDADELTRSPSHTAARGVETNLKKDDSTRGLSVRFPRLKVWNRDKDLPNTVAELVKLYELRKNRD